MGEGWLVLLVLVLWVLVGALVLAVAERFWPGKVSWVVGVGWPVVPVLLAALAVVMAPVALAALLAPRSTEPAETDAIEEAPNG